MNRTVIIGLGNPILTDDSVGIKVARHLSGVFRDARRVEVKELYAGGIRLLDALIGYERAVIVDAIRTLENEPGRIHHLTPDEIRTTWNTTSMHDMNLSTALEMGSILGLPMPRSIDIWGIEGADLESFSESLSAEVARAVPRVVSAIVEEISRWMEQTQPVGV